MILEELRNFDWYNEPLNVRFIEEGMLIETKPKTDFWQNVSQGFSKDDGHFFATPKDGNFVLTARWRFEKIQSSAQCGIMIRDNSANWIKLGLLSYGSRPQLGAVVAREGICDWSVHDLPNNTVSFYLKIKRQASNFLLFYSLDGQNFAQIRLLALPKAPRVLNIGAYACSPKPESFECILEDISVISLS
jgi:hypothetical protein